MYETGTLVEMTKGYRGARGRIIEMTESDYEFYVLKLKNGIHVVAGPTAFVAVAPKGRPMTEDT